MSKPQPNLFALEAPEPIDLMVARRSMPATVRRVVEASGSIQQDPPERADFLHSVLCQVGMPRKKTEDRTFERESGTVSIMLEAGRLWNGRKFVEQPFARPVEDSGAYRRRLRDEGDAAGCCHPL